MSKVAPPRGTRAPAPLDIRPNAPPNQIAPWGAKGTPACSRHYRDTATQQSLKAIWRRPYRLLNLMRTEGTQRPKTRDATAFSGALPPFPMLSVEAKQNLLF